MIRIATALLALMALGACSATTHDASVSISGTADAERALLASIANVERASATVNRSYAAVTNSVPSDLNQRIQYTGKGTLDEVVGALARSAGYRFTSNATPSTRPVTVAVQAQAETVFDLLQKIGTQAGSYADIVVRAADRTVEVRYHA